MSKSVLPSANQAASALLQLGFTLTGVMAALFFVVHFGDRMHAGEALLYAVGAAGGVLILRSLLLLLRELTAPLPSARRPVKQ